MDRLPTAIQDLIEQYLRPSKWATKVKKAMASEGFCSVHIPVDFIDLAGKIRSLHDCYVASYHHFVLPRTPMCMEFADGFLLCITICDCGEIAIPHANCHKLPFIFKGYTINVF